MSCGDSKRSVQNPAEDKSNNQKSAGNFEILDTSHENSSSEFDKNSPANYIVTTLSDYLEWLN